MTAESPIRIREEISHQPRSQFLLRLRIPKAPPSATIIATKIHVNRPQFSVNSHSIGRSTNPRNSYCTRTTPITTRIKFVRRHITRMASPHKLQSPTVWFNFGFIRVTFRRNCWMEAQRTFGGRRVHSAFSLDYLPNPWSGLHPSL